MEYSGVIAVLLATGFAASAGEAGAYEWQLVQGDEEQAVFVDRGSIERDGDQASAWVLKSFSGRIELGHHLYPHRSQKLFYEFNCSDATYKLDKWVMTDGAYGEGDVVWTGYSRFDDRVALASNSSETAAAALICSSGDGLGRVN
jgi:hypothetical protein